MTVFHGAQIVVAAVAAFIAGLRVRSLAYRANLDAEAFLTRLAERLEDDPVGAAALCEAAKPAWVARVAAVEIAERAGSSDLGSGEEIAAELRREAVRGVLPLITIGRAASPLAFVGVMVELGMAFQGGHGLAALQRGLVEQVAMQNAVVGVTLGLATSTCCFLAAQALRTVGQRRLRESAAVAELFA